MTFTPWSLAFLFVVIGIFSLGMLFLLDRLSGGPAKRARNAKLLAEMDAADERERQLVERQLAVARRQPTPEDGDWVSNIEADYAFIEGDPYVDEEGRTRPSRGFLVVRIPEGEGLGFDHLKVGDRFGTGRKTVRDIQRLVAEVRRLRALESSR